MLVHPNYKGYGIAVKMLDKIKAKYKDYFYIEGMPEDKDNFPFYTKHGFVEMENGEAIQIVHDIKDL